jgi:hypothetical protein
MNFLLKRFRNQHGQSSFGGIAHLRMFNNPDLSQIDEAWAVAGSGSD